MPRKKSIPAPEAEVPQALEQTIEIGDTIELISAQIISFTLPHPEDDSHVKFIEDVDAYTFGISTRPQSSSNYFFRFFIDIDCKIHFKDESTLDTNAQALVVFRVLTPVDESKIFRISMLPLAVQQAAVSIAYSTSRGLFIAKTSGTILQSAILPILSPASLMTVE